MTTARRKRELDAHARDMQWDWVNEEDLKVFAKVSRGWFVGELAEERVRGGGGGGGGGGGRDELGQHQPAAGAAQLGA